MAENIFDLVFESGEDILIDSLGHKIGSRQKVFGNPDRYDFFDTGSELVMYALARSSWDGSQYVEFYRSYNELLATARVETEVWGVRKVVYYDRHGSRVAERYVDERTVSEKKAEKEKQKTRQGGSSGGNRDRSESSGGGTVSPPPSGGDGSGGALLVVSLVCMLITAAFTALYNHMYMVLRVSSFICVFLPVPLMLYIFIRMCHKKDANEVRAQFFKLQLIMLAAAFVLLSILHFLLFFPHLSPINTDSFGFFLFCFAPCVLHGIGNAFLIHSFRQQYGVSFWEMGDASAKIMNIGSMVFIYISQMVLSFSSDFTPGILESFIFVLLMLMVLAFCAAAGFVASLPYKLLKKLI